MPVSEPIPLPRCPLCGALKNPDWRVCEHCGAGAARPAPASRRLLWAGLGLFTVVWVAGLVAWWYFSYRVTLGPLIAGSAIEIDGKPVTTFPHGAAEYSALLSRGQHAVAVTAPGHTWTEFDFRIGWTGLRRHVTLTQVPEVACVTLTGAPSPAVTVGASWPDHPVQNEFCAPAGTQAVAEWRPDATQPPVRQAFQYTNDGDVVVVTQAAASTAMESPNGAQAAGGLVHADPGASAAALGVNSQAQATAPGRQPAEVAKPRTTPNPGPAENAGTVYRVGNGVSAPSILYKQEPEYTEQARKANLNGTVLLYLEIDPSGRAQNIRVLRGLGLGLDKNAVESIGKWRFRPGYKDGRPVTTSVQIAVRFRLR
jgi:TonB family protein